tara:strand:- start:1047 stop:1343 length:297 start_codon:yes stop_codon:yes gene_type:complete
MIKKSSKLPFIERKFCSCLIKVGENILNPFGICTNSVYSTRGKKRTKQVKCFSNYDFKKFSRKQLLAYKKSTKNKKKHKVIDKYLKTKVKKTKVKKLY